MNPTPGVRELLAGAAALVRVCAFADFPRGFIVIPETLPPRIRGVALGDGVGLARLYGVRYGQAAVLIDPARCNEHDPADLEALVLHEAAHALTSRPADDPDELERALDDMRNLSGRPPERAARDHCPRWAFAFAVLSRRALQYRALRRAALRAEVAAGLERYGYAFDRLDALAAEIPDDEPIRPRLAVDGVLATFLESRFPDETARGTTMVAAGMYGATGVVG